MNESNRINVVETLREMADKIEQEPFHRISIERKLGMHRSRMHMEHNGTETIIISINGGARDTEVLY